VHQIVRKSSGGGGERLPSEKRARRRAPTDSYNCVVILARGYRFEGKNRVPGSLYRGFRLATGRARDARRPRRLKFVRVIEPELAYNIVSALARLGLDICFARMTPDGRCALHSGFAVRTAGR